MTQYIIVNYEVLPMWVMSAFISFTILGHFIGLEIERHGVKP